jgi:hypothetical protein
VSPGLSWALSRSAGGMTIWPSGDNVAVMARVKAHHEDESRRQRE